LVSRDAQRSDWRYLGMISPVSPNAPLRVAANQLPNCRTYLRRVPCLRRASNGRARFSGNADVSVGSNVNADEDVGVPGQARTPLKSIARRPNEIDVHFVHGLASRDSLD